MIQIKNLTTYVGNKEQRMLFHDVSLEIPQNKITAFVGPSGIGKTTLLYHIAKIFKANNGTIEYFDANSNKILNPKIDLVFQDFNLFDNLNVTENIEVGNGVLGLNLNKDHLLKQAELININPEILKSDVKQISGGEKQRVAILRALNRRSDFILLDEPTGNLDLETSKLIFDTLKELSKTKTIVIVSHNYELVENYADKIVKIEDAKLVVLKDNSKDNIKQNPQESKTDLNKKPNTFNKFKIAFKFIKNDLKTKLWQVLLIIASLVLAIFSTLLAFNLNTGTTKFSDTFVKGNNLDLAVIRKPSFANFSDQEIQELKQDKNVKAIYAPTPVSTSFSLKYNNNSAASVSFFQINNDDFFIQRYKSLSNVSGSFITNKNEILINENFAKKLGLLNPVNQTISLEPTFSFYNEPKDFTDELKTIKYDLKIVGQFKTLEYQNQVDFWIHQDFLKDLEIKIANIYAKYGKLFNEISHKPKEGDDGFFKSSLYVFKTSYDLDIKLIEGSKPSNYNEIIVSNKLLESAETNFNFKLNDEIWAEFKSNNRGIILKIVGIYDSEITEFRYQQDIITKLLETTNARLHIFFDANASSDTINNDYLKKLSNKYSIIDGPSSIVFELMKNSKLVQFITFGLFIIFIALFGSFLTSYLKSLSDSKRKNIGILKALGTKPLWILFYQSLHVVFILFFTLIAGLIIVLPSLNPVINLITGLAALETNLLTNFIAFNSLWLIYSSIALVLFSFMSFWQYKKATNKLLQ
ncbi:ABC transporter ATP-binding protein [Mycoplasmopsis bovirhinis]|uniref:ATP-binding cassette domain-containing protein n=1 Tax=Mycoplasmopsis bovirhinis TaxID=29553 RepID=UPI000BB9E263|nr:ATP-binding cassette domain-containing protein [Mycoplasmopsis bovirhinis]BBA22076.1 ABC transporter ATP-binding protein [Mycoplasmopsis bovirhinis]